MFKIALVAVLAISATAINIQSSVWTAKDQKVLAQISQSNWGSFILNYAELHLQTGGILQELVQAIDNLIDDLEEELGLVHAAYHRRTDQHNREVTRLEQEIQDKERELFNAHDFYDNVLIPQRDRFATQLEQLEQNIALNRQSLIEETHQREVDHDDFEAKAAEHNEAIEAIDEALTLLSQLGTPSLVQVKKIQKNIQRIQNSLKRHATFQTIIKALLQIASDSNFADQGALKQIVTAFNDLRVQLVNSLNVATADEAQAQSDFVARVNQLNAEHSDFQRQVVVKTAEIDANAAKIEYTLQLIDDLTDDLAGLNAQLDAENDDFAAATDVYNGLVAEYNKELNVSRQAQDLLNQPRFQEYVKSSPVA
ncbi:Trichocyst matrix protein T1-B [Paramecium bursaria]